jgi:hypothetical protein
MENHESIEQIDIEHRYLHPMPNFGELRQTTVDAFETASLPQVHRIVFEIPNHYLRFAYGGLWSILVYLAYKDFKSRMFASRCSTLSQKADAQGSTRREEAYIKGVLVGDAVDRRKFRELLNRGELLKTLVLLSDCGILLLAKQQISLLTTQVFGTVIEQYLSCVRGTEDCRNLVCEIFSAFSPTTRVSISFYTNAYEQLRHIILPCFADDLNVYRQNRLDLFNAVPLDPGIICPDRRQSIHFCRCHTPERSVCLPILDDHFICSTRTLLTSPSSNTYLRPRRLQHQSVFEALCALSIMYFKHTVPHDQLAKFNKLELTCLGNSIQYLQRNALNAKEVELVVTVGMLLVHYSVCHPDRNSGWLVHAKLLCFLQGQGTSIDFPEALFIVYQTILTLNPSLGQPANHGIDIEYLLRRDPDLITDLGPSKRILWFIGKIAEVESTTRGKYSERVDQGKILEIGISKVSLDPVEGPNQALVLEIGELYKIWVLLLARCRLLGLVIHTIFQKKVNASQLY